MKQTFKDLFSDDPPHYAEYRPHYPAALFSYLASISKHHFVAWDCATGSGQSAVKLVDYFDQVIATDASQSQLDNAAIKQRITYRKATAENSGIETNTVDLITVSQALHWFNLELFSQEVNRVLKDEGLLAVWTYNLLSIRENIDAAINHLYHTILANCWSAERKIVETGYCDIEFPFDEKITPEFHMTSEWNLIQLTGYLNTWSAVKSYQKKYQSNPVELIYPQLLDAWGDPLNSLTVSWPLSFRLWKKLTAT